MAGLKRLGGAGLLLISQDRANDVPAQLRGRAGAAAAGHHRAARQEALHRIRPSCCDRAVFCFLEFDGQIRRFQLALGPFHRAAVAQGGQVIKRQG
jgi:hypothetical protein